MLLEQRYDLQAPIREGGTAARVHPTILRVYDVSAEQGADFVVRVRVGSMEIRD